jgi:antitoxin YefM
MRTVYRTPKRIFEHRGPGITASCTRKAHERVVITRNGRPEAVILAVSDLEALEETLDLLSTPGALEQIRAAEAEIARGEAIDTEELRRLMAERVRAERVSE